MRNEFCDPIDIREVTVLYRNRLCSLQVTYGFTLRKSYVEYKTDLVVQCNIITVIARVFCGLGERGFVKGVVIVLIIIIIIMRCTVQYEKPFLDNSV